MDDWTREDVNRLGIFLSSGMVPEKAERLVSVVRAVKATADSGDTGHKLLRVTTKLIEQGMGRYEAVLATLCHPSDHEPYLAIGADYLTEKGVL